MATSETVGLKTPRLCFGDVAARWFFEFRGWQHILQASRIVQPQKDSSEVWRRFV